MNKITCDILIRNARILTEKIEDKKSGDFTVRDHMTVAIKDGKIQKIFQEDLCADVYDAPEIIDNSHLLWMPGLTDAHMHTCQQLLRGRILDELPMIWTRIMLPFESSLTPEAVGLSAGLAAMEMLRGGVTSFVDAGGIHMEEAAFVYKKSGLRGMLTLSTMDDEHVPASMQASREECVKRLNSFYDTIMSLDEGQGLLSACYSLRSLISCSQGLIEEVFAAAKDRSAMVEAHMNEYPNEINYHLERYHLRPMEYLESLGVLSSRFLSAHSILLSENEMELMKERGVKAVHCPFSNCGKGVPNAPALLKKGIPIGFGSDGTAHGGMSIFQEMKIFRSVMNVRYGVPESNPVIMPADSILSMATKGGAYAMGQESHLGEIKEDYLADLIAIDLDQPHLYPTNNLVHTLVESVSAQDVVHSVINGRLVMKNRRLLTLDEERLCREAGEYLRNHHQMEGELCYR